MKKDYRKYSETSKNEEVQLTLDDIQEVTEEVVEAVAEAIVEEATETEKTVEEVVNEIIEETTEEVVEESQNDLEEVYDEIVNGELNGCTKLNVRAEATKDSDVVCVLNSNTEFTVNVTQSTEDFYKVYACVNEVLYEGFCVKQFVNIK